MGVITDDLCLAPQGVVVIWEWEWIIENDLDSSIDLDETNSSVAMDHHTSTVTFKCIGAQHNPLAQSVVKRVSSYLDEGQEVYTLSLPIHAIAFKCWIDNN